MAYLDFEEANKQFQDRVLDGIGDHFPIEGKKRTLHLDGLQVKQSEGLSDDIQQQYEHKVQGKSLSVPVVATLSLKDNVTGKVVDSKKIRLAEVPVMTRRYSQIVDGQEYQFKNQWQLKPGVYARRRSKTGEIEAQFNIPNKTPFDITFDPSTKQFMMDRGKSKKIPMYPLMKAMGVTDDQLKASWGEEVLEANKNARGVSTALQKFYKSDKKAEAPSPIAAAEYLTDTMAQSRLRPDATAITLGKAFSNVQGDTLRLATQKMIKVQGGAPEDDRDSLEFKDLRSGGDYAYDKLTDWRVKRAIKTKALRKINTSSNIREIVKFDSFNNPVKNTFSQNSLAVRGAQINPLEMLSASQQTTIMGPGGIRSEQQVVDEQKFINPSHLGYLDPLHTPEDAKTGISLRLPMGVKKVGKEPHIPLYNLRTRKVEHVNPVKFAKSSVVLADQVEWKNGIPVPITNKVKMSGDGNQIEEGYFKDAKYVMRHPSQAFNVTTNLIPFLGNTSGVRARAATSHLEQAISLRDREAPLVQTSTGHSKQGYQTFEQLQGTMHAGHSAGVAGEVVGVSKNAIKLKDSKGEIRKVQLYNNFPLNDKNSVLISIPLVKVGDKVSKGQAVADTNFTKGGTLALGTNLRVAYLPFKGYNFEDGVVISEGAAKKLTSIHMHKPSTKLVEGDLTAPNRFKVKHPGSFDQGQYKKLDDQGVVRVGQEVRSGDPLVLSSKPFALRGRMGSRDVGRVGQHTDASLKWEQDQTGKVVGVHRNGPEVTVHVRTAEQAKAGDKLAGRYGNKGVIAVVLPDKEMPHTPDGEPIEVALNPSGVPGRMNVGQVLETAAAKVARKTGKPYVVSNFTPNTDQLAQVKADLSRHGISDTEELTDPVTGVSLGEVLTGPQYMLKLTHQIDKKISARAGMGIPGTSSGESYDLNLIPTGGAKAGGQSIGSLGFYALLAQGAKANIREMQTWKSEGEDPTPKEGKKWASQHRQVWKAIQEGTPLPTPRSTYSFNKFTTLLRGSGINVEKKGHLIQLSPLTDKQILAMSSGAITKPQELTYSKLDKDGEPKPKKGGLFDPKVTGGHAGKKWSHIKLAEPVANPVFAPAIQRITGLSKKDYVAVATGEKAINSKGAVVVLETPNSKTGGAAIKNLLGKIDVDKELAASEAVLNALPVKAGFAHGEGTQKIDAVLKKVKHLRALKQLGMKPAEAYILHNLPIIPPKMRPAAVLESGDIKWDDINGLYSKFGQVNEELKEWKGDYLTDDSATKKELRKNLYDGVSAIMGTPGAPESKQRGILQQIHGTQPKKGYFQNTLMNRRQDMSMRSVIVPEPALSLDEIGLPRAKAATLFRPFLVKKLVDMGAAKHALEAQLLIKEKHTTVDRALDLVAQERPVLLKRDPALHKHSVQAFKPKLVSGEAIRIHPLVTSGFNADFDGDTMSAYVPIGRDAVEEAKKMFPSNNLFNEATGRVAFQPTLESALGLYKLSRIGKDTKKKFKDPAAVLNATKDGKLGITDLIHVSKVGKTTPGRLLLSTALPEDMRKDVLTKHDKLLDKKGINSLFNTLATDHKGDFGTTADKLKDLGNGMAFGAIAIPHPDHKGPTAIKAAEDPKRSTVFIPTGTHTLSLADFTPDKVLRDRILGSAQKRVNVIQSNLKMQVDEKESLINKIWGKAADEMRGAHIAKESKNPSNLFLMQEAGVKPSWDQYKQLVLAPVQVTDAANRIVPIPIKKSYAEGLDLGGYWTQAHGARRGTIQKVQEVQEPGFFSKNLMNTSMNLVVNGADCGTTRGVALNVASPDVYDRELVRDFSARGVKLKAGTLLDPTTVDRVRAADKNAQLVVRSALKCEHGEGLCQKCAGVGADGAYHDVGTNIGAVSAQSLGERAVQLTLKAFHSGGVRAQGSSRVLNDFGRVKQLTSLPRNIPDAAALAMKSGSVEKIERDKLGARIWIGGKEHYVGKDRGGLALHENLSSVARGDDYVPWTPPKVGMKVEAGQFLSDPNRTFLNPHDLYKATNNMEKVQNHLVKELHGIYSTQGVRRQNVETVVKAMGNLTKVRAPGDADGVLKGEFQPTSVIRALNTRLVKDGKRPVMHSPILKGVDVMPLVMQEDWMAKLQHQRLRDTIMEGAASAAVSNLHGLHPIPAAAYGAEFGLTSEQSARPGLRHLADIPSFKY